MSSEQEYLQAGLNQEELEELRKLFGENPIPEERQGIFSFFNKILKTLNTRKVSNLDNQELNSVRILENAAAYAKAMNNVGMNGYFRNQSEVTLATALSKKGFFIDKAVTSKKESTIKTGGGEKSKWSFGKKTEE